MTDKELEQAIAEINVIEASAKAIGRFTDKMATRYDELMEQVAEATDWDDEHCSCCGSGLDTVSPCPHCGDLICQDCADGVHFCNIDWKGARK